MEHFDLSQSTAPRPASLKHRAYDHIRQKLFDGRLGEGAHLSPVDLGKEIGISHIPVREAITQLASEGLVVHIARQGAFVRQMQRQELLELFELRGMLETATIIKVAKRIRPAELGDLAGYLKGLADVVELFRAVDDGSVDEGSGSDNSDREYAEKMVSLMGEWTLADLAFHMLLLRIGGNRQVTGVIAERQIMLQMFRHRTDSPEAWNRPLAKYYEENFLLHQDIYEAVRQADPKAARRAMAAHTMRARKNMLARFDWLRRQKDADSPMARDFPDSMQRLVQGVQSRFIKGSTKT